MSVHLMCVIAQAINVIVHTHSLPRQQLASKLILIKSGWIHSLPYECLGFEWRGCQLLGVSN